MMKAARLAICLTLALLACSCRGNSDNEAAGRETRHDIDKEETRQHELALPRIPDSISAPRQRADYIMSHFYDMMDFADHDLSLDTAYMEQNFVNFIQLYGYGTEDGAVQAISNLISKAASDKKAFLFLSDIAEHYLYDPNSPMRNEDLLIMFLQETLRYDVLTETERIRPSHLLQEAQKNRPGMTATDFSYVTRDGTRQSLHHTTGKLLLLLFYDPDCENCRNILNRLHQSTAISRLVDDNSLTVLAVYTEGDRKLWDQTKDGMPQEWIVAIDESRIADRELYALPAMPVIYLLDKDKKVLLKDPTIPLLESRLGF